MCKFKQGTLDNNLVVCIKTVTRRHQERICLTGGEPWTPVSFWSDPSAWCSWRVEPPGKGRARVNERAVVLIWWLQLGFTWFSADVRPNLATRALFELHLYIFGNHMLVSLSPTKHVTVYEKNKTKTYPKHSTSKLYAHRQWERKLQFSNVNW